MVLLIPLMIFAMLKVKRHYNAVRLQLRMTTEQLQQIDIDNEKYNNRVIVPIASINRSSLRALKYAKSISDNVTAFYVSTDEESLRKEKERFELLHSDIPFIVKHSPYRKVVQPLLEFIKSTEYDYKKGDMITVILPQFSVKRWWHKILHNQTRVFIERELLKHRHIVVAVIPLQFKDDNFVLHQH